MRVHIPVQNTCRMSGACTNIGNKVKNGTELAAHFDLWQVVPKSHPWSQTGEKFLCRRGFCYCGLLVFTVVCRVLVHISVSHSVKINVLGL